MLELLRKSWWTISVRGLLIALFGVLAIMDVQQQKTATDGLFNAFTIFVKLGFLFAISGALLLIVGIAFRKKIANWFVLIITALPDIVLAIYIFANGEKATYYFGKIMGIWIVVVGFCLIVAAVRIKNSVMRAVLGILALICLIFGAFVELNDITSLFIVYGAISYFTVLLGLVIIVLGFAARKIGAQKPGNQPVQTPVNK